MLAHLGGIALEESIIYLVPPLAVLAGIYALGWRSRRNPPPPETDEETDGCGPEA